MDELKKEMIKIIKSIDRMHKKDPDFENDLSRNTRKQAVKIVSCIDRGVPEVYIKAMLAKMEKTT